MDRFSQGRLATDKSKFLCKLRSGTAPINLPNLEQSGRCDEHGDLCRENCTLKGGKRAKILARFYSSRKDSRPGGRFRKVLILIMVGTGRFELPTPRTPSECSTRLSHVPTVAFEKQRRVLHSLHRPFDRQHIPRNSYAVGGTYSLGTAEPSPKKNWSICSTRNSWASRVQGCRRYSFSSIFWRSSHSSQARLDTL